jgi:hypothetical protein
MALWRFCCVEFQNWERYTVNISRNRACFHIGSPSFLIPSFQACVYCFRCLQMCYCAMPTCNASRFHSSSTSPVSTTPAAATPDPTPAALNIPCNIVSQIYNLEFATRLTQPTPARHTAPTAANTAARMTPHSSKISKAATLLMMTAQETALALLGRSYLHINSSNGKSLVKLDTSSAVLMTAGCG